MTVKYDGAPLPPPRLSRATLPLRRSCPAIPIVPPSLPPSHAQPRISDERTEFRFACMYANRERVKRSRPSILSFSFSGSHRPNREYTQKYPGLFGEVFFAGVPSIVRWQPPIDTPLSETHVAISGIINNNAGMNRSAPVKPRTCTIRESKLIE